MKLQKDCNKLSNVKLKKRRNRVLYTQMILKMSIINYFRNLLKCFNTYLYVVKLLII